MLFAGPVLLHGDVAGWAAAGRTYGGGVAPAAAAVTPLPAG
eukprot:gene49637-9020_t